MLVRYGDTCSEFPDPPKVNQGWLSGEIDKDRKEREFPDPPEVIHGQLVSGEIDRSCKKGTK